MESMVNVLLAVIGLLATGLGTLALFQITTMSKSHMTDSRDQWKAIADLNKEAGDMREAAAKAKADSDAKTSDLRTHLAENYARNSRLDGLEQRIFEKLDDISKKLDTKMDKS